jgi:hypothetical protein
VGWDLRHQVLRPLLAYCTAPDDRWGWLWSNWWNEDWQGKTKYSKKTCPSAILSTTNPTWPDPCANTGRRGGKPATNRLSYGAANWYLPSSCYTFVSHPLHSISRLFHHTWLSPWRYLTMWINYESHYYVFFFRSVFSVNRVTILIIIVNIKYFAAIMTVRQWTNYDNTYVIKS